MWILFVTKSYSGKVMGTKILSENFISVVARENVRLRFFKDELEMEM